ncbi:SDR family NAD(P)-dependent oxidoreductase [Arthrobacter sp. PsM3]|uniref:SDR family NAD(P)-dependent oxidoreductase n=1 Tax=Arthrobacter sp. PsM3 TaxID=3030531 RepID=UPI00263B25DE|nr:SDR family NAD(P)-dependent oxidoreductase [Arthrobacter sp. PsM3]MDN4644523.1 SDR family NAD(P)-dependent oxidoreductase [Arthrobacter sp. PsM3]
MSTGRTLNVLVTGGSGPSGIAAARALRNAGHRVFTVGSDGPRIEAAAAEAGTGVTPLVCDLADLADVRSLHATIHALLAGTGAPADGAQPGGGETGGSGTDGAQPGGGETGGSGTDGTQPDAVQTGGAVDGVIHLVGGWRGAKGITDQSDEDWEFLERGAITTLRNVTRVFYDDLAASDTGRFTMVSSTAVAKPTAGGASYVAAKAAAEAWTLAVADGFHRAQSGRKQGPSDQHIPSEQRSAAVVFVVKALVDAAMRAKSPDRGFPGFTDVEELAAAAVGLFTSPAADLNGQRLLLGPGSAH